MPEASVPHTRGRTTAVRGNAALAVMPRVLAVGHAFAPWLLADLRQQVADHG